MNELNNANLRSWLDEAMSIVDDTRAMALGYAAGDFAFTFKEDGTFVTEADTSVETAVRSWLRDRFPEHGVVGEEFEDVNPDADYQWIIDPIDGTHSFRHRVPLYGTILGLVHREIPVLGVIDLPAMRLRVSGALGQGAFCNGERNRIEDVGEDAVEHEIIAVGDRKQFAAAGKEYVFDTLMSSHPTVRTYTDCFGHVMALLGSVGAMVDYNLSIWDSAATEILVKESGGKHVQVLSDVRGDGTARYDVVFGKPRVVDWLLGIVD
jgi:histidinol-phosphatase